jgi:TatD DNase family protein
LEDGLICKQHRIQQPVENIDIHCHATNKGNPCIVSIDTKDFQPGQSIGSFYSLGLHPWFIERQDIEHAIEKIVLSINDPKLLAIGECGLDKLQSKSLAKQIEVFKQQIKLADQSHKPLIIHCVRAFNELLQLKKSSLADIAWVIHGFNSKPAVAEPLLKQGFYLSMGKALLNPQSNAAKTLQIMPLQQLFLETDAAEDILISDIYTAAARIVGLSIENLQQQIFHNFKRVFLHD